MKPGSNGWKRFMAKFRSYTRIIYAVSIGVIVIVPELTDYFVIISGCTMVLAQFMAGFEPIHEYPNWELVYPELALGYSDEPEINEK
jgi:hypothetical protein